MTYRGMQPLQDAVNAPGAWRARDVYTRLLAGTWPIVFRSSDPYFAYVQALLQPTDADAAGGYARDYGGKGGVDYVFTNSSGATITTAVADPAGGSRGVGNFIGANRALVSNLTNYYMRGQPFTISFYVRPVDLTSAGQIIIAQCNNSGTTDWGLWLDGSNIRWYYYSGTSYSVASVLAINTWYHVAFAYDGTIYRIFVNGVLIGSVGNGGASNTAGVPVVIGGQPGTTNYFRGYLADVRLYEGVCVWTSAFTPPAAYGDALDAYADFAKFIVPMTGAHGATTFANTARAGRGNPVTKVGTVTVSNDGMFDGYGAYVFDGVNTNYLNVTAAPFAVVGSKTLEYFGRRLTTNSDTGAYTAVISNGGYGRNGFECLYNANRLLLAGAYANLEVWINGTKVAVTDTGGAHVTAAGSVPLGADFHIAMCFDITAAPVAQTTYVGSKRHGDVDGANQAHRIYGLRIDNFRRYSGTTIPVPTTPFPTTSAPPIALWNPADRSTTTTLSNGDLTAAHAGAGLWGYAICTLPLTGARYWEVYCTTGTQFQVGVATATPPFSNNYGLAESANAYIYATDGNKWTNKTSAALGAGYTTGDVIGVAYDADARSLRFYRNGVLQGTAFILTALAWRAAVAVSAGSVTARFKQSEWAYAPPSGFTAIVA